MVFSLSNRMSWGTPLQHHLDSLEGNSPLCPHQAAKSSNWCSAGLSSGSGPVIESVVSTASSKTIWRTCRVGRVSADVQQGDSMLSLKGVRC